MSFFKDFKEDLLQAADELIASEKENDEETVEETVDDEVSAEANAIDEEDLAEEESFIEEDEEKAMGTDYKFESVSDAQNDDMDSAVDTGASEEMEVTAISKGVRLEGNLKSEGAVNLLGSLVGDIECKGKLVVEGTITGNSKAAEVFASNARIEGDIESLGSVKVASGSVIIGNIIATSAVIAGAVKGDIDVKGPVIVDTTAVVLGNIKSRTVQLNNGAVLDGIVSQCYSGVDVKAVFEERASKK